MATSVSLQRDVKDTDKYGGLNDLLGIYMLNRLIWGNKDLPCASKMIYQ